MPRFPSSEHAVTVPISFDNACLVLFRTPYVLDILLLLIVSVFSLSRIV
uniref:Uncharacterized protein n=1 Tax=Moniliophthora roreri TaxID=221103 RepID=A0A0W0FZZ2_MONRR